MENVLLVSSSPLTLYGGKDMKKLKEIIQNDLESKIRLSIKKAEHDAKKSIKGFCSNPYCYYCL